MDARRDVIAMLEPEARLAVSAGASMVENGFACDGGGDIVTSQACHQMQMAIRRA